MDKGKATLAQGIRNTTAGPRSALGEIHNVRKKVSFDTFSRYLSFVIFRRRAEFPDLGISRAFFGCRRH